MELLSSVRKWLSSASSQSYDSISQQTPDSLLSRAKAEEMPGKDPSVMAPIPSQNYIPPTEVRPFSEEITSAVREQYRKFQQPKEVVKLLSELAIDPTTYIPASKGIGITAAGLGILTGLLKAGTISRSPGRIGVNLESQIGAFRPSGSVISPLSLTDVKEMQAGAAGETGSLSGLLWNKISNKELQKYGTPEFLMDSKLLHVADPSFKDIDLQIEIVKPGEPDYALDIAREKMKEIQESLHYRRNSMNYFRESQAYKTRLPRQYEDLQADIQQNLVTLTKVSNMTDQIVQKTEELGAVRKTAVQHVRAMSDADKAGKEFYTANASAVGDDMDRAVVKYAQYLEFSPLSPDQLSKKSLQQLLMHADDLAKKKEEILRKEEESLAKLPEFMKARTATLQAEQGLPDGFVELKHPADFGAETEFLNHCVGAGGYDVATKKYKFQVHPISGREVIKNSDSSYSQYKAAMDRGQRRFFSYRPEGKPVLTFEVDTEHNGIMQIHGLNDRDPTETEQNMIIDFVINNLKPREPPAKIPYEDQI